MKTILITGVGGPAGANLAAMLVERGCHVVGVDLREVPFTEGLFLQAPPVLEPQYLPFLQEIVRREGVDLVIPTLTEELPLMAGAWSQLEDTPVVISSEQAVAVAQDKYSTAKELARREVAVPKFGLPSDFADAQAVAERLGWPCVVKPRRGRGGRGVRLVQVGEWGQQACPDEDWIVQEFVPGIDYAPNVFVGEGESFAVVLEKTALREGITGNALSVERVEAADVARTAILAAQAVGLTGPLDVDIRRRANGQPVVLEINARFGANIRCAPEVLDAVLKVYFPR